jgi:hypothetical protein
VRKCLMLPFWSLWLTALVGLVYLFLFWQLQNSSRSVCFVSKEDARKSEDAVTLACWAHKVHAGPVERNVLNVPSLSETDRNIPRDVSLMGVLASSGRNVPLGESLWWEMRALGESPPAILALVLLFAILYRLCSASGATRWIVAALHVACHVLLAGFLIWAAATLVAGDSGSYYEGHWRSVAAGTFLAVLGGILGTFLLAAYFVVCTKLGGAPHMNEAFAARRSKDYKHFVRLHIDASGLTAYVVGIDRVVRWNQKRDRLLRPFARRGTEEGAAPQIQASLRRTSPPETAIVDSFAISHQSNR